MRHIPEDELHAYLDQALSRSQCVEIECHLAGCRHCQLSRDEVAAVRDRITALLAAASVSRRHSAPPFTELVARHEARVAAARIDWARVARRGALAAGLVAALATGWLGRSLLFPGSPAESIAADGAPAAPETPSSSGTSLDAGRQLVAMSDVGPLERLANEPDEIERVLPTPAARVEQPRTATVMSAPATGTLTLQVASFEATDEGPGLTLPGLSQTVDWYQAYSVTGGNLARIDGLPVVDVQVQPTVGDARPLVVVAQQHPSGRLIKTIEGPEEQVSALVDAQQNAGRFNASSATLTPPDYLVDASGRTRRGLRVAMVTGGLPADTLNALVKTITLRD
ncbi:MAG: zf-HC2 domain-containing protein [Gemmatimonadales bacterium]